MKDFCISAFLFLFGICHYILHWVGLAGLFAFGFFFIYISRYIGCFLDWLFVLFVFYKGGRY